MPIKVKDHDKCKEWERRRRDRLNDAFKNLAQLLPHYDPAKIPAKIDILEKSTEFVKELRLSNSRLLSNRAETDEKCKLIKELQDEVNKLILRVKQLTILLKQANITIPSGPEIKSLGIRRFKWSGRLAREDVKNTAVVNNKDIPKAGEHIALVSMLPEQGVKDGAFVPNSETTLFATNGTTNQQPPMANGVTANSTAVTTRTASMASIIVPLKEINKSGSSLNSKVIDFTTTSTAGSRCSSSSTTTTTASSPQLTTCQTSPTSTIVASILTPPIPTGSIQKSPTKFVNSGDHHIFTTTPVTPLQFPIQTFIIAPCPSTTTAIEGAVQPVTSATIQTQPKPQLTRIASILPAPIFVKGQSNLPFQKLPIKSLLKPIPRVIKRRRRRKKNDQTPADTTTATVKTTETQESKNNDKVKSLTHIDSFISIEMDTTHGKAPQENSKNQPSIGENKSSITNREGEGNDNKINDGEQTQIDCITACPHEKMNEETSVVRSQEATVKIDAVIEVTKLLSDGARDAIIIEHGPEDKTCKVVEKEPEKESPSDSVPVLRIIETCSLDNSSDILSTIVIENAEESITPNATSIEAFATIPVTKNVDAEKTIINNDNNGRTTPLQQLEKTQDVQDATIDNVLSSPYLCSGESKALQLQDLGSTCMDKSITDQMDTNNEEADGTENRTLNDEHEPVSFDTCTHNIAIINEVSTANISVDGPRASQLADDKQTKSGLEKAVEMAPCLLNETFQTSRKAEKTTQPDEDEANSQPLALLKQLPVQIDNLPSAEQTAALTSLDSERDQIGSRSGKNIETVAHAAAVTMQGSRKEITNSANEAVAIPTTTEKISECIARSIDLIDANDSELMELGEHWEDAGASPKSISPTQIFLNMFPLLPRESSVTEPPQQQQQHSSASLGNVTALASKGSLFPATATLNNSRSSFFIDAMLPDEHAAIGGSSVNENADISCTTSNSPFLPLTPPQFSSNTINQQMSTPFSLPSNYYWTPPVTAPTVVTSSSGAEYTSLEYRSGSHGTAFYQQLESQQQRAGNLVAAGSSSVGAPTTTSTNTTKTSATQSTPLSTVQNVIVSNKSDTQGDTPRSSKRSKSVAKPRSSNNTVLSSKMPFIFDTNAPASSSNKPVVSSTGTKSATPTSVAVTWTLAAPSQSHSSTCQQLQQIGSITATKQNSPEPLMTAFTSLANPSCANQIPSAHPHSCSILDSLNPMDAAFFRPLMNALDTHDFRSIDFSGGNSAHPPPPLPSLIPAPSNKTLYASPFSNTKPSHTVPSSNSNIYSDHDTATKFQGTFMHPSGHIFTSGHVQPLSVTENVFQTIPSNNSANVANLRHQDDVQAQQQLQHVTTHAHDHQSAEPTILTFSDRKNIPENKVSSDKTLRISGRHKSESIKKNRSGKATRMQPYGVPTCHPFGENTNTRNKIDSKHEHHAASQNKKTSQSYSFHTIQSHLDENITTESGGKSSTVSNVNCNRSHNFHVENIHPSSSSQYQGTEIPLRMAVQDASKNSETKTPKSAKENKNKVQQCHQNDSTNFAAKQSKTSRNDHAPPATAQSSSTSHKTDAIGVNNVPSPATENKSSCKSQVTAITTRIQPVSVKLTQHQHNVQNSDFGFSQVFQMHHHHSSSEPFQLFPEFGVGTINSRASTSFSNTTNHHAHSHHYHHQHDNNNSQTSLPHHSQEQLSGSGSSNLPLQRSHPYYFPDIASSLENMPGMPVHQSQPHHHTPTIQQIQIGKQQPSSSNNNRSVSNSQDYTQPSDNNNISKYAFGTHCHIPQTLLSAPASQLTTPQEFPHINEQQHQRTSRPQQIQQQHQSSFGHQNSTSNSANGGINSGHQTLVPTPQTTTAQQTTGSVPRHRNHDPASCPLPSAQRQQNRCHYSLASTTATTTSTTPSSLSVSSGKVKQSNVHSVSFHVPISQQQHHHPQIVTGNKPQQQQFPLHTMHHLHHQQNVAQQPQIPETPNRSSSSTKTVNWMTDTAYRSTSTATSASGKHQRQVNSVTSSTSSNPFSVSKLVGPSSSSGLTKSQHASNNVVVDVTGNIRAQPHQSASQASSHHVTPAKNKTPRSGFTSTSNNCTEVSVPNPAAASGASNHSHNQSSYCAEALIRKNPLAASTAEWAPQNFNTIQSTTGPPAIHGTSYSVAHSHHHPNPSAQHQRHHHQNAVATDSFPSYSVNPSESTPSYHYAVVAASGGSHGSSSSISHYNNFDHPQQLHYHEHPHSHQHTQSQTISSSNNSYNSTSVPSTSQQQRQHSLHNMQLPTQNTSGSDQGHYHSQHNHHPNYPNSHQHQSSTSSVTNFNLSTIFPEINDKRSRNTTNLGGAGGGNNNTSGNSRTENSTSAGGGMLPIFNYHQPNFGNLSGGGSESLN